MEILDILNIVSCLSVGVFLGAQITEAFLFVPNWEKLNKEDFYFFYNVYGKNIHVFFASLTIIAFSLSLLFAFYSLVIQLSSNVILVVLLFSSVSYFSTYFLYFKKANTQFYIGALNNNELRKELIKWKRWHWLRIAFEFVAFICLLLLLL